MLTAYSGQCPKPVSRSIIDKEIERSLPNRYVKSLAGIQRYGQCRAKEGARGE